MFFYAFGTLLFAFAMAAAMSVMMSDFAHYRRAMMKALRSLSLDGLTPGAVTYQPATFTLTTPVPHRPSRAVA